jgi:hypothetical protein
MNKPEATPRGPLGQLVDYIAQHKPVLASDSSNSLNATAQPPSTVARHAAPGDAQMLQFFRRTWSRLSAEQRLAQSQSTLPENAGPLHSHQLVHRSLTLMRELSPAYFEHFIAHVDALLWIEQNPAQRLPAARKAPGNPKA